MHRFFLTEAQLRPDCPVDLGPISHQLRSVLRLHPGDQILLLDGHGNAYPTEIRHLDRDRASGHVLAQEIVDGEPLCFLTLYQCALKADKFEWVLQKGTEIGVSRFVPVLSSRTIVRPAEKLLNKYERWRAIIREAAEQSRRGSLPELADPLTWEGALATGTGVHLLPWEKAPDRGVDTLGAVLEAVQPREAVSLLIGPEGGISNDEASQAIDLGWRTISLGPRILRAETAAIVASALVLYYQDRLG